MNIERTGNDGKLKSRLEQHLPMERYTTPNGFLTNTFIDPRLNRKEPSMYEKLITSTLKRYEVVKNSIEKSFIIKVVNFFGKYVEKYKTKIVNKKLRKNFNSCFNVDHNRVMGLMGDLSSDGGDIWGDIAEARKKNNCYGVTAPSFVDFDVIDIHNENLNPDNPSTAEILHEEYKLDTYGLRKQARFVNQEFYEGETLGQKIKRLSTD